MRAAFSVVMELQTAPTGPIVGAVWPQLTCRAAGGSLESPPLLHQDVPTALPELYEHVIGYPFARGR